VKRFTWVLTILLIIPLPLYQGTVPEQLSNEEFWKTVVEFSEKGGDFPSENFVSNEQNLQIVLSRLRAGIPAGLAYIGVGPEQNFTYIAALKPRIAFIVDIRRQNMIQHLIYKALFESSVHRSEFLARLFSRTVARDISDNALPEELIAAYRSTRADETELKKNIESIWESLTRDHGFNLSASDRGTVEHIMQTFALHGMGITYSSKLQTVGQRGGQPTMPAFAALMTAADENGVNRGFLGSESNFQVVRDMQRRNLVVPIVGDFGGNKAIRAISAYLVGHDTKVGVFYLSNVEQYLFTPGNDTVNGGPAAFYENAGSLPLTPASMFIRSRGSGPGLNPGFQSLLSPMMETIRGFEQGKIVSYTEVFELSK
jgi:hypothetical protein